MLPIVLVALEIRFPRKRSSSCSEVTSSSDEASSIS